jgi:hypothetical protein
MSSKLADMGVTMHPDARLRRGSQTIRRRSDGVILDKDLLETVNQRCKGYRC